MTLPEVLVGCPTSDHKKYCLKEYVAGVKDLTYPNKEILIVDNSKTNEYAEEIRKKGLPVIKDIYLEKARDRIVHSRNILKQKALAENFDYFLSLEQDVIPEPETIQKLLENKVDIISGVVMAKHVVDGKEMIMPMAWVPSKFENKMRYLTREELKLGRRIELIACSLSCLLIHRRVLEKVNFRYEDDVFDDIFFCQDARKQGFRIFVDTTVRPKHWPSSWEGIQ